MAGSLSIKYVLPAVWFENEKIRNHPWFSQYVREKDGRLLEPYEALDPLPFGDDAIEDARHSHTSECGVAPKPV